MRLQDNSILITGGSSGIGLELAEKFIQKGNKVLICGRTRSKLESAKEKVPKIITFQSDLSTENGRRGLFEWVHQEHPDCNVLINNAALVHRTSFKDDDRMQEKALLEIQTNLIAPIALSKHFLPLLEQKENAAIINITSGLAYTPKADYPIYNATKAGLHSFTKTLRMQLHKQRIRVVEVLMPVVDTPWHEGKVPKMAISSEQAVGEMLEGLTKNKDEIRVGKVRLLYWINRISPKIASKVINRGS